MTTDQHLGFYAAVMIAERATRKRLPLPATRTDGLDLYDREISIEPGVPFEIHYGYSQIGFDPKTHPGITYKYRYLDEAQGLGRDISIGQQDPESGLWYVRIADLELIDVQGTPTPFHFPHIDYSEQLWGEVYTIESQNGTDIVLVPQAPYVEAY